MASHWKMSSRTAAIGISQSELIKLNNLFFKQMNIVDFSWNTQYNGK
jgi:hypothetical protein